VLFWVEKPIGIHPGQYWDEETGLDNNWHRNYDPASGRYVSKDPIGFDAGDLNVYRYVSANPANNIDPEGLDALILPGPVPLPLVLPRTPAELQNDQRIANYIEDTLREKLITAGLTITLIDNVINNILHKSDKKDCDNSKKRNPNPIGKRIRFKTKKDAYEAAKNGVGSDQGNML
jgi:RHS repeat-associated protein